MEQSTSNAYAEPDPLPSAMTGASSGSPLFVINLCASIAPVQIDGKGLPGLENYKLYQVKRVEDGRTRHRLRLGFFTSESHAEGVLTVVRQQYPTAFTACLCEEDRRFARGYLPDSAAAPSRPVAAAPAPAPQRAVTPSRTATAPTPPASNAPTPAKPPASTPTPPPAAAPKPLVGPLAESAEVIEVTWEPNRPKPAAAAASRAPGVAEKKGPATDDDFSWDPPALNAAKALAQDPASTTARHPVLSAGFKTQPVIKTATAAPKPAPTQPPKPAAPAKTTPAARAETPAPQPKHPATSMRVKALDLTFSDPPPAPAATPKAPSNEPFHVGKGVQIGELPISLDPEPARAPAPKPQSPSAPKLNSPAPAPKPAAAPPKAKAPPAPTPSRAPDLDTTQTIRALTSAELNDDSQEKWFAIQLAASEQPVNLDTMPHLDIFEAYRLYSIATAGSGKIVHSLRLGFFKEAVSAEAVCGYLNTFFGSPSVMRISQAEYTRFKDSVAGPRRPATAEPAEKVELTDTRTPKPAIPTVTMEVPNPRLDQTGSFRTSDSGSFKPNATGAFKAAATGAFQTSASGSHKVLTPTLKPAAKSALATRSSEPMRRTGFTGKYKAPIKKSLSEQLIEEARQVELSESGIRKLPKSGGLLSKLLGK